MMLVIIMEYAIAIIMSALITIVAVLMIMANLVITIVKII